MNRMLLVTVAITASLSFTMKAQAQREFSGTWIMDESRSESAIAAVAGGSRLGPVTQTISQADGRLIIQIEYADHREAVTYRADGAESREGPTTGSMRWDGSKLVTSTVRMINGMAVTSEQIRSVSRDGKEMVVETTTKVEHGYTGALASRGVFNGRDIFKKGSAPKP